MDVAANIRGKIRMVELNSMCSREQACAKWAGGADPLLPLGPSGFLAGHCDGWAEILSKVTVCHCHTWERDLKEWTLFDLPSYEKGKAANVNSHQGYQLNFTHNETGKSNLLFLICNFSRKKSVINIKWKLSKILLNHLFMWLFLFSLPYKCLHSTHNQNTILFSPWISASPIPNLCDLK